MMKKLIIFLVLLLVFYGILFLKSREIQAIVTFPGVFVNTLEFSKNINPDGQNPQWFEDIYIYNKWKTIHGVWFDNKSEKTIYYFHGSWGDVRFFYEEMRIYADLWYNVMSVEYPGYWQSTWFPYEENLYIYAKDFLDYMWKKYDVMPENTILWWYSIWTGVAAELAQYEEFEALILFAPFTSLHQATKSEFGFLWQKLFFLWDSMKVKEIIWKLHEKIIIVHGKQDWVYPISGAEELVNYGDKETLTFIGIDEGNHYNLWRNNDVLIQIDTLLNNQTILWK